METNGNPFAIFPQGEKVAKDYFTGNAWVNALVSSEDPFNTAVYNVSFEPGARNHWHVHPAGQVLLVTDGVGYFQQQGEEIKVICKGDVVKIPAGIVHWHGASPNSAMTHIAITFIKGGASVEWLDAVTENEYNNIA
jgi:quercetin dioxygenase-like cupin family protein